MARRLNAGIPGGMEGSDDDEFYEDSAINDQLLKNLNGENFLNGFKKDDVGANEFSGLGDEKQPDKDELEEIFDNGVPVDETFKLNADPSEERPVFSFKNINEVLKMENGDWASDRRVSFKDEAPQINYVGFQGGKRRRTDADGHDELFEQLSDKPQSRSAHGFDAFRFKSQSFAELRDELEQILHAAEMDHLLPSFRFQGIGLKEFLILDDPDFEKLGIISMGDRMRLKQLVADVNAKPWTEKSLIQPGPNFSVADAVKMVSNIHGHLVCMESSLLYLRRIADNKQLAPMDKENHKKLLREINSAISDSPMFDKRLRELRKSVQHLTDFVPDFSAMVDEIDADTELSKMPLSSGYITKAALMISGGVALYIIYRKFKG